jgi:hypothetical protein
MLSHGSTLPLWMALLILQRERAFPIWDRRFPSRAADPEALGALQRAEIEKWWPIIKAANIKRGIVRRSVAFNDD